MKPALAPAPRRPWGWRAEEAESAEGGGLACLGEEGSPRIYSAAIGIMQSGNYRIAGRRVLLAERAS